MIAQRKKDRVKNSVFLRFFTSLLFSLALPAPDAEIVLIPLLVKVLAALEVLALVPAAVALAATVAVPALAPVWERLFWRDLDLNVRIVGQLL